MGKDPDVAEDFAGDNLSIEKILRQRQRDEICGSLKAVLPNSTESTK
jgi:hypothetical protein